MMHDHKEAFDEAAADDNTDSLIVSQKARELLRTDDNRPPGCDYPSEDTKGWVEINRLLEEP